MTGRVRLIEVGAGRRACKVVRALIPALNFQGPGWTAGATFHFHPQHLLCAIHRSPLLLCGTKRKSGMLQRPASSNRWSSSTFNDSSAGGIIGSNQK